MKLLQAFISALIIIGILTGIFFAIELLAKGCETLGIWLIGVFVLIVLTVGVYNIL